MKILRLEFKDSQIDEWPWGIVRIDVPSTCRAKGRIRSDFFIFVEKDLGL